MKTAVLRFLVRWYQASDQPLPPWLERTVRNTPELASIRSEEVQLTSLLRSQAPVNGVVASPFLKSKVLHALARDTADSQRSRTSRWILPSAAVAASLALGLLLASTWLSHTGPSSDTATPSAFTSVTPAPVEAEPILVAKGIPAAWANPLDQEIASVVADAEGAVRFLASAFLPSEALSRRPDRSTSG